MKVAIVGSRDFNDFQKMDNDLEPYRNKITTVISGGAKGADSLAEDWADKYNINKDICFAKWNDTEGKPDHEIGYNRYGEFWKLAGHNRNDKMAKKCDACIAFWDGESSGTKDMIDRCKKYNKPLKIIKI